MTADAQDTNHWSTQFGTRAHLLGGAVVGSSDDLSAVFYNPGALALVEEEGLLLTSVGAENSWLTLENGFGPGEDVTSTRFTGLPSLVAGELPFPFLGSSRLAYSVMGRSISEVRVRERLTLDDFENPPDSLIGLDAATAELLIDQRVSEYWGGLTFATPIGEKVGLGISTFVGVRNHRSRFQTTTQLLAPENRSGLALFAEDFSYSHWRLFWKIGLSTRLAKWRVGISVTTPSIKVFGDGKTSLDRTASSQGLAPGDEPFTRFASDLQEKLPSTFDSPFSIAFGGARSFGAARVHFSAEWFDKVPNLTILDSDPVFDLTTGEEFSSDVTYGLEQVFNVAVGYEHVFSDRLELYGGFHTDFSGNVEGNNGTMSNWDIYHISGGIMLVLGRSSVTLGTVYAFGSAPTDRGIDFIPDGGNDLNIGAGNTIKYRRLTALLGFQLDFSK